MSDRSRAEIFRALRCSAARQNEGGHRRGCTWKTQRASPGGRDERGCSAGTTRYPHIRADRTQRSSTGDSRDPPRLASTHPQLSLHNADVTPTLPVQERAFARSEDALVAFLQVRTVQINPRPRANAETDARTHSCPLLA
eukprot:31265-Pelagococcus_subviridis.AAC.12